MKVVEGGQIRTIQTTGDGHGLTVDQSPSARGLAIGANGGVAVQLIVDADRGAVVFVFIVCIALQQQLGQGGIAGVIPVGKGIATALGGAIPIVAHGGDIRGDRSVQNGGGQGGLYTLQGITTRVIGAGIPIRQIHCHAGHGHIDGEGGHIAAEGQRLAVPGPGKFTLVVLTLKSNDTFASQLGQGIGVTVIGAQVQGKAGGIVTIAIGDHSNNFSGCGTLRIIHDIEGDVGICPAIRIGAGGNGELWFHPVSGHDKASHRLIHTRIAEGADGNGRFSVFTELKYLFQCLGGGVIKGQIAAVHAIDGVFVLEAINLGGTCPVGAGGGSLGHIGGQYSALHHPGVQIIQSHRRPISGCGDFKCLRVGGIHTIEFRNCHFTDVTSQVHGVIGNLTLCVVTPQDGCVVAIQLRPARAIHIAGRGCCSGCA